MQRSVVVPDRAAEEHEAVVDERVHERRMTVPVDLLADLSPRVPGRPVDDADSESSHTATVGAGTDSPAVARADPSLCTPPPSRANDSGGAPPSRRNVAGRLPLRTSPVPRSPAA